ncbi:MAG: OB-fold nucleic acid binding domain-containing protein [Candidatus Aenigmarchaeota archaeon]|nr:OB-fold nucleic acid binding domain-containing protein [Candidatus Aenigmarchaeota archaeon]
MGTEVNITRISLAFTVIGIAALFFVTEGMKPLETTAAVIDDTYLGKEVSLNSTIKSLAIKDGNIFITLEDKDFRVVVFKNSANETYYNLKRGNKIAVVGKVHSYKNSLEIIAEEIRKIS